MPEDARWNHRVPIVFKNATVAIEPGVESLNVEHNKSQTFGLKKLVSLDLVKWYHRVRL